MAGGANVDMSFIDFLKVAVEQSAEVVLAEEATLMLARDRVQREKASDELVERLEALGKAAIAAMESVANQPADTHGARIRDTVIKAAQSAVVREVVEVKRQLAREVDEIQAKIAEQRRRVMRAAEALILSQDLSSDTGEVHIALRPDLSYSAGWLARTDYGVEFLVELRVDPGSLLARDLRVNQLMPNLEIHAPELAGWIRKQTKMVGHRVDRYHVVGIGASAKRIKFMLRATADMQSAGFDITVHRDARTIDISRAGQGAEAFDVDPADVSALLELGDQLAEAAARLRNNRSGLLQASIGGTALDALERPTELVDQIIAAIAPKVHEVARKSPPDELVLRRQLGDNRREELFVSKAELLAKIERVPAERRNVFAPLQLDRSAPEPVVTPPSVAARSAEKAEPPPEQDGGWDLETTAVILLKKGVPTPMTTRGDTDRGAAARADEDEAAETGEVEAAADDAVPEAVALEAEIEEVDVDLASEVRPTPVPRADSSADAEPPADAPPRG